MGKLEQHGEINKQLNADAYERLQLSPNLTQLQGADFPPVLWGDERGVKHPSEIENSMSLVIPK